MRQENEQLDEVSLFVKITVAANNLVFMAARFNELLVQYKQMEAGIKSKGKENDEDFKYLLNGLKNHEQAMNRLFLQLRKANEDFGNYVDGCDSIDEIDAKFTERPFDIIYDRKMS